MIFMTQYHIEGSPYGSEIQADTPEEARMLAIKRNIGERVVSAGSDSLPMEGLGHILGTLVELDGGRQFDRKKLSEAIHAASFMCYVGMASGALSPREVLGDRGLIHLLSHLAAGVGEGPHASFDAVDQCRCLARDFETRIPGWPVMRAEDHLRTLFAQPGKPVGPAAGPTPLQDPPGRRRIS